MSEDTGTECPKCGKLAKCYCRDAGSGGEFLDEYTLHCPHCGYKDQKLESGGSTSGEDWNTKCPFCGAENPKHPEPPKKLVS